MLKKRLITVLTLNEGVLFRTKLFEPDYRYTLNFVDAWSIDEIILLDITRTGIRYRERFVEKVNEFASKCFVPLSAGGGVRTIDDFHALLGAGADKVVVNTGAVESANLIGAAAERFGSQCVVVSVDARLSRAGGYEVYTHCGSVPTGLCPAVWARRAQDLGAGEMLITSIERDGSLEGYDNRLNRLISDAVSIPVLCCGGAGRWQHFVEGFGQGGVSGVCTTNIYHFTETSIRSAKTYLHEAGIDVRLS